MTRLLLLCLVCLGTLVSTARADTVWLCRPDLDDACDGSLQTTVVGEDGTSTVEDPAAAADPGVDCFYVYPTVSEQPTAVAERTAEPSVVAIAKYQAGRFAQHCRVFAPLYRQRTLFALGAGLAGAGPPPSDVGYLDVREAWQEYLRTDNGGRGVVFVGHSQGTGVLRRLIREEVDPKPAVRKRVVSAALIGGNAIDGEFPNLPACRRTGQLGCVLGWSTFLDDPPESSRFGRPVDGRPALCTNPGSLAANETSTFQALIPRDPFPGVLGAGLVITYGGPPPMSDTAWLAPGERYAGRCETINGKTVLKVAPVGDARRLNPFPEPGWGLHLADVNLPYVQLLDVVEQQVATYRARSARTRRAVREGVIAAVRRTRG